MGGASGEVHVATANERVGIKIWNWLEFDRENRRVVFSASKGSGLHPVVLPDPMALPVVIADKYCIQTGGKFSIWWAGPRDNERLAAVVVDALIRGKGPNEVGLNYKNCFVATVIFGERSEEVAVLRKWRDERLSESVVGRALVKAYYRLGPICAVVVQGNAFVRRPVRAVLLAVCHRLSRRI